MIDVEALTPDGAAAWDEFLLGKTGALVYHSAGYRDLLTDHLGCEAEYLVATEGGEIRGALPLMWSGQGERVLNSLPFYGSHGAPVAETPEAAERLIEAWNERATDGGTLAATMVANPFLAEQPPVPVHTITDERISQATPLPPGAGPEQIMEVIRSEARRNVRKAERLGVAVERDDGALGELHAIHEENMRAIGGLAKPREFFEALARHFRPEEDYGLWLARLGGEVVAALLVLRFNGVVEYFTSGTAHEHRSDNPHSVLLIAAMSHFASEGDRLWNWGGTWVDQTGVYRFKRKWGAEESRYSYFTQLNDRSVLESSPEQLLERFPHFYVVPFSELQPTGAPR